MLQKGGQEAFLASSHAPWMNEHAWSSQVAESKEPCLPSPVTHGLIHSVNAGILSLNETRDPIKHMHFLSKLGPFSSVANWFVLSGLLSLIDR